MFILMLLFALGILGRIMTPDYRIRSLPCFWAGILCKSEYRSQEFRSQKLNRTIQHLFPCTPGP